MLRVGEIERARILLFACKPRALLVKVRLAVELEERTGALDWKKLMEYQ